MKNIFLICLFFISLINVGYSQEWIPHQPILNQTNSYTHYVPVHIPQPVLEYRVVPVVIQQNIVVERYCLFHKTQTIVSQPVVVYSYQPVWIYR